MSLIIHDLTSELQDFLITRKYSPEVQMPGLPNSSFHNEHIEEMLSYLDPDMDHLDWVKVGMALHADNRDIRFWVNWSRKGQKFKEGECEEKWSGFSQEREVKVTIGTLVDMAKKSGWKLFSQQSDLSVALDGQSAIRLFDFEGLNNLPRKRYLIKGLLNQNDFSEIFGPSNSGKTFVAIDIGFHVALGMKWCEKNVRQGTVVYVASEGGLSIRDRLDAFRIEHKLEAIPNFYVIPDTVLLNKEDSMLQELLECLSKISDVSLVVVDTLARSMGGADENSSSDMGAFINNCGLLQKQTGAHVMVVHHTGKDVSRGARGHSSLKAAIDTEIEVSQSNRIVTAKVTKQRDGEIGDKFSFELSQQMLGKDEDGDFIISCALKRVGNPIEIAKPTQTQLIFDLIKEQIHSHGVEIAIPGRHKKALAIDSDTLKERVRSARVVDSDKADSFRKAIDRAKCELQSSGHIEVWSKYILLADKTDKADGQALN